MELLTALGIRLLAWALPLLQTFVFFFLGGRVAGIVPLRPDRVLALTVASQVAGLLFSELRFVAPSAGPLLVPLLFWGTTLWLTHRLLEGTRRQTAVVIVTFVVGQVLAALLPDLFVAGLHPG